VIFADRLKHGDRPPFQHCPAPCRHLPSARTPSSSRPKKNRAGVDETRHKVPEYSSSFQDGLINPGREVQQVVRRLVSNLHRPRGPSKMMKEINLLRKGEQKVNAVPPLRWIAHSGAPRLGAQIKQPRRHARPDGPKPSGEIIRNADHLGTSRKA